MENTSNLLLAIHNNGNWNSDLVKNNETMEIIEKYTSERAADYFTYLLSKNDNSFVFQTDGNILTSNLEVPFNYTKTFIKTKEGFKFKNIPIEKLIPSNDKKISLDEILRKTSIAYRDEGFGEILRNKHYHKTLGTYFGKEISIDLIKEIRKAATKLINLEEYEIFNEVNKNIELTLILDEDKDMFSYWKFKKIKTSIKGTGDIFLGLGLSIKTNIPRWEIVKPNS